MKQLYSCFFAAAFLLAAFLQSCKEENVEERFLGEQVAAKSYYLTNVLPILNSKCFSCHNYHSTSETRYDTYVKAAGAAEEIVKRTSSAHANTIMPPPSADPLTEKEKQVLQQFLQLVKGNGGSSEASKGYSVSIFWTAFKFPGSSSRVGVTGTFDNTYITYRKKDAANIYEFLTDAEILIPTNSANVGNDPLKSSNVVNHFFSYFTPVIHGRVMDINPVSKEANIKFTMNGISQVVPFQIQEAGEDLIFTGRIRDIGYFNSQAAVDSLQKACGEFHKNTLWPDINLRAEIKEYRKFYQYTSAKRVGSL